MIIGVVGKGRACPVEVLECATLVGQLIARAGHVTLTGGLGGCMEAAPRGAKQEGGMTIGIVPLEEKANPFIDIVIRTGMTHTTRNIVVATTADAMVVCHGSHGTLQELAVALDRGIPIAAVGTDRWSRPPFHMTPYSIAGIEEWLANLKPQT